MKQNGPRTAVSLWLWVTLVCEAHEVFCHRRFDSVRRGGRDRTSPWHNSSVVMTLGWGSGAPRPWSSGSESVHLLSLTLAGKFLHLISFLGKLFWMLFLCFVSSCFQKGFGSQLSPQGVPEISLGSLKAGGQRPLSLPCSEWCRGGFISSSADWSY